MVDTVEAHLRAGTLRPRKRVSTDDLWTAVEWLRAYEGDPEEDANLASLATVADRLAREATRREQG